MFNSYVGLVGNLVGLPPLSIVIKIRLLIRQLNPQPCLAEAAVQRDETFSGIYAVELVK